MRIAIVHYHLAPGGVTTVIRAASTALSVAGIPHVILAGSGSSTHSRIIPGLSYSSSASITAEGLLAQLRAAAAVALGGPPDLWHFHNHSLGKNVLLPRLVALLAEQNEALVLQLHDLAEDGRPQNYPLIAGEENLYPVAPRIHYAFLNSRDRAIFHAAGLPPAYSSLLPNLFPWDRLPPAPSTATDAAPLFLYPSRAIRRKNIGELLLLSLLAPARQPLRHHPRPGESGSPTHLRGLEKLCPAAPAPGLLQRRGCRSSLQ